MRKLSVLTFFLLSQSTFANTLSLSDVMHSAEKSYPAIEVAQQEIEVAKAKYLSALGGFDPTLMSTLNTTPEGGYENIASDTSLIMPIQNTGAKLYASYRVGRGDWPIYYKNNLTNDAGETVFGLSVPLLRDFSIDENRAKIKSNKLAIALKNYSAQSLRIDILRSAGNAYWAWVAAAHRIRITAEIVELANVRQHALEKKHRLGDVPEIQLVENQRFILQRQAELIRAKLAYQQAAYLLSLFYRDRSGQPIIPAIKSVPNVLPPMKMMHSKQQWQKMKPQIIAAHPDMSILKQLAAIKRVALALAENNLKPQLDANAGTKREYGISSDPRLRQRALELGIHFEVPLWRRQAKGEVMVAKRQLRQLAQKTRFLTQQLAVTFTNVLNQLIADKRQADLLNREVTLAKKVERAEAIRFNQGDSSLFLVNQREQTTFALRLEELKLRIDFLKSRINLRSLCAFRRKC